jgi:heme exporter protein D
MIQPIFCFGCVGLLLLVNAGSSAKPERKILCYVLEEQQREHRSEERVPVRETSSKTEGHMHLR